MGIPIYRSEELRKTFWEVKAKIMEFDHEDQTEGGRVFKEWTFWYPYEGWALDAMVKEPYEEYGREDKWYTWEWEHTGKKQIGPPKGEMYMTMNY